MKFRNVRPYLLSLALVGTLVLAAILSLATAPTADAIFTEGCTCGPLKQTQTLLVIRNTDCMWAKRDLADLLRQSTGCNGEFCYDSAVTYTIPCQETAPGSGLFIVEGFITYQCLTCD